MIKVKEKPKAAVSKTPVMDGVARALSVGGRQPPKPPIEAAASAEPEKFTPVTLSLAPAMIKRLDDRAHEMRKTRSAAARVLLSEALK